MKFSRNNLPGIVSAQYKEKMIDYVSRIKRAEVVDDGKVASYVRIDYLDGSKSMWVSKDGQSDYVHYCEAFAGKRPCPHLACGVAISEMSSSKIERFALPKDPDELNAFISSVPSSQFHDVSDTFGIPAAPEEEEAPAAAPAPASLVPTPAPAAAPIGKRDPKVGWKDIENYLLGQGIDRRLLLRIVDKRKAVCDLAATTPMSIEPVAPSTPYQGKMLERALRHIIMGKSLLLVGDKGAGKDTLINTIAWVLGYPMYLQTGHKGYTSETIIGENMPTGNGLEVAFKYTAYATCVMNGGLVHFAELNMLMPDATSIFHSVYDDNKQLSTPLGTVPCHQEHMFIASINVGEHYAGVKALNAALKDRLAVLHLPYTADFKLLIEKKSGLTDRHVLQWLEDIKTQIDLLYATEGAGDESRTVRGYIDAANYLKEFGINDQTKIEAIEDFVINKCEDREERFAVRNQLRMSVWKSLPKTKEEEDYESGVA
ncbi:AAA family ATPase [Paenibacillus alginolyticus]|uniref:AAA family ATPase n=1 Tax=Paenibacillus alginolyticus TaxID=59839 RepID=UPI00040CC924|nr:AAA family ATPase [Paenibacillus alginolyticus]MCY9665834.1 AAA family ATPase [Paenibacillus alginolyticus]